MLKSTPSWLTNSVKFYQRVAPKASIEGFPNLRLRSMIGNRFRLESKKNKNRTRRHSVNRKRQWKRPWRAGKLGGYNKYIPGYRTCIVINCIMTFLKPLPDCNETRNKKCHPRRYPLYLHTTQSLKYPCTPQTQPNPNQPQTRSRPHPRTLRWTDNFSYTSNNKKTKKSTQNSPRSPRPWPTSTTCTKSTSCSKTTRIAIAPLLRISRNMWWTITKLILPSWRAYWRSMEIGRNWRFFSVSRRLLYWVCLMLWSGVIRSGSAVRARLSWKSSSGSTWAYLPLFLIKVSPCPKMIHPKHRTNT